MSRIIPGYTPLAVTDFSWVNQDTATAATYCNAVVMTATAKSAADSWEMLVKTAPTIPYSFTVHMSDLTNTIIVTGTKIFHSGIVIRESSSGKLKCFGIYGDGQKTGTSQAVAIYDFSSPTAWAATILETAGQNLNFNNVWFRVINNNTNRLYFISRDGINFTQVYSEEKTAYMTENQIGISVNPSYTDMVTIFDSFKVDYTG
jgi:hypothetical protein